MTQTHTHVGTSACI